MFFVRFLDDAAILADFYDIEIASLDVETCHQYLFGATDDESKARSKRIYLVYSGVHYDALQNLEVEGAPQRIFSPKDELAAQRALLAARLLQSTGSFTNVSKFSLRCTACNTGLVGAVEAQEHARVTGHTGFEEYQK
jgi:ubiquitin thioesterase OTU1